MKPIYYYFFIALFSLVMNVQVNAQTAGTAVCMEISNIVLTSPNEFTFDVNLKNSGTSVLGLRGYACGINITPGLGNGGTLTATYLSRDTILQSIPAVTAVFTSPLNLIRFTTVNAVLGNDVNLIPMVPYRLATIKMKTTTNFDPLLGVSYDPFNPLAPSTPLQVLPEPAKTTCEVNCIVNPTPMSSIAYQLVGIGAPLTTTDMLSALTGVYNSWGTCSSVSTSIKDPSIPLFKLNHNQTYSELQLQAVNEFKKLSVRILDMTGKIVMSKSNLSGTSCTFDFNSQPSGLYIFEILEGNHKEILKFVKN